MASVQLLQERATSALAMRNAELRMELASATKCIQQRDAEEQQAASARQGVQLEASELEAQSHAAETRAWESQLEVSELEAQSQAALLMHAEAADEQSRLEGLRHEAELAIAMHCDPVSSLQERTDRVAMQRMHAVSCI